MPAARERQLSTSNARRAAAGKTKFEHQKQHLHDNLRLLLAESLNSEHNESSRCSRAPTRLLEAYRSGKVGLAREASLYVQNFLKGLATASAAGALAPAMAAVDPCKIPAKWDVTTEVLVIGSGGAGLASAVSAAQGGAKVTVMEKLGFVGGNTMLCSG